MTDTAPEVDPEVLEAFREAMERMISAVGTFVRQFTAMIGEAVRRMAAAVRWIGEMRRANLRRPAPWLSAPRPVRVRLPRGRRWRHASPG